MECVMKKSDWLVELEKNPMEVYGQNLSDLPEIAYRKDTNLDKDSHFNSDNYYWFEDNTGVRLDKSRMLTVCFPINIDDLENFDGFNIDEDTKAKLVARLANCCAPDITIVEGEKPPYHL